MAQAITDTIPFQALTPPRMLEELSGRIDKLAPPPRMLEELSGQVGKLAPAAVNEYVRDLWQRSVLFLDILRQRGNQHDEMATHGVTSVLMYESELVCAATSCPNRSTTRCCASFRRKAPRSTTVTAPHPTGVAMFGINRDRRSHSGNVVVATLAWFLVSLFLK
jgi:hypothetical protein